MAKRLTGTFKNPHENTFTVDVYDNDWGGAVTTVTILSCKVLWDSEKSEDRHAPIIGSRVTIGINVPADDTTLSTFIEDFAYGEEARFLVEITKSNSPTDVWKGVLVADQSGEEDIDPFTFRLSGVCGLALLKSKPYYNGVSLYGGIDRLTEHLIFALTKMPHTTAFWTGSDPYMRTAVDWWSASMSSGANDDALYQAGVDHSTFYDFHVDGGVEDDCLSSYEVLSEIMKVMGCRIYQCEGVWRIEQIPYRSMSPYYTRDYDVTGAFLASAVNSGTNVINRNTTGAKLSVVNYDFLPIFKKVQITYNAKRRRNLLSGKNLQPGNDTINFNQLIDSNGGDTTIRLRGVISYGIRNDTYSGAATDHLYAIPTIMLKAGTYYYDRTATVNNYVISYGQGQWNTNSGNRIKIPIPLGQVPTAGGSMTGSYAFDILTTAMQADSDTNALTFALSTIGKWNGAFASPSQFTINWSVSGLTLEVFDEGVFNVGEDQVTYEAVNPLDATLIYKDTLRLGFSDTQVNALGRLFRWDGAAWVPAELWGQGVSTRNKYISDLLALNILNGQATARRRMNGSLYGAFRLHRLMDTTDGRKWMFSRAEWDLTDDVINGSWFELDYGVDGVSSTPIKKKVVPNGPTYPPIPDPTNPNGLTQSPPGFSTNPAPTVLAPVSYNQLNGTISAGDTVTSIPIKTASLGNEFLAGDGVTLVNPFTGAYQTFTIATAPALGATSLSVTSATAASVFPEDSYLVVKQNAYAFSLPTATNGDYLEFNGTEWVARAFNEDVDDRVAALLVAGANITLTYNDGAGTLTIASASGGTVTSVAATAPPAGFTITGSPITTSGTFVFALADDLAALEGLSGTGILVRTAANTYALRTLSAGAGINITFPDGVAGNPVIAANTSSFYYQRLKDAGTSFSQRGVLNITDSVRIAGTLVDDAGNDETELSFDLVANSVADTYLSQRGALTVMGRAANSTGNVADIVSTADGQVLRRNGTTLDWGTVVTAGITNSAVTYAKIQNVSATNRVLGRITAGPGVVEELTPANLQTLLGISGTAGQNAYFGASNAITSSNRWLWDNTNGRATIVGQVAGLGASNAMLNIQPINLTSAAEMLRMWGNITGNAIAVLHNTNTSTSGNSIFQIITQGTAGGDPMVQFQVAGTGGKTVAAGVDNNDSQKFKITPDSTSPGGVIDQGLIITQDAVAKVGINKDAPAQTLDVNGTTQSKVFVGLDGTPTVVFGAGAGTGPTNTLLKGGSFSIYFKFSTGTAPTADGIIFTITVPYAHPYTITPVWSPGNANTAAELTKFYNSANTTTTFQLKANGTLTATTPYELRFILTSTNSG